MYCVPAAHAAGTCLQPHVLYGSTVQRLRRCTCTGLGGCRWTYIDVQDPRPSDTRQHLEGMRGVGALRWRAVEQRPTGERRAALERRSTLHETSAHGAPCARHVYTTAIQNTVPVTLGQCSESQSCAASAAMTQRRLRAASCARDHTSSRQYTVEGTAGSVTLTRDYY